MRRTVTHLLSLAASAALLAAALPLAAQTTSSLNSAIGLPSVAAYGAATGVPGTGSATGSTTGSTGTYGSGQTSGATIGAPVGQGYGANAQPLDPRQLLGRNSGLRTLQGGANAGRPGQPGASTQDPLMSLPPYVPGEFEQYVQGLAFPVQVRRLGAELMQPDLQGGDPSPMVPADYVVVPGDELAVTVWGSVDVDTRVVVDRSGRISLPRAGSVMVAGTRFSEVPELINRQLGKVLRNFNVHVSMGQLRGIRVYLTGFVSRPGSYVVSSLSTVSSALIQAGGPTASGSYRQIEIRRRGQAPVTFDLYDLLVKIGRAHV